MRMNHYRFDCYARLSDFFLIVQLLRFTGRRRFPLHTSHRLPVQYNTHGKPECSIPFDEEVSKVHLDS